jgi:hypothetical protein
MEIIKEALVGTDYEGRVTEIAQYMSSRKKTPRKELYTGTLHKFGRNDGTAIYRILKDVI